MRQGVVLVVDDDRDTRDALVLLLSARGFTALAAENGQRAIEVLRTSAEPPNVVVLDLMMPVLSGWRLLETLTPPGVPIIVITGASDSGNLDRHANVDAVMKKPVNYDALLTAVSRLCNIDRNA